MKVCLFRFGSFSCRSMNESLQSVSFLSLPVFVSLSYFHDTGTGSHMDLLLVQLCVLQHSQIFQFAVSRSPFVFIQFIALFIFNHHV